jgi:hypothetical protein
MANSIISLTRRSNSTFRLLCRRTKSSKDSPSCIYYYLICPFDVFKMEGQKYCLVYGLQWTESSSKDAICWLVPYPDVDMPRLVQTYNLMQEENWCWSRLDRHGKEMARRKRAFDRVFFTGMTPTSPSDGTEMWKEKSFQDAVRFWHDIVQKCVVLPDGVTDVSKYALHSIFVIPAND